MGAKLTTCCTCCAAPGMEVVLFDGSGCEFDAEVAACRRSTVELAISERREVDRELP